MYHAIHTQIIIDVHCDIRFVESGFGGNKNDAMQFAALPEMVVNPPLPHDCFLVADNGYTKLYIRF